MTQSMDHLFKINVGPAEDLQGIADDSVQCLITSPPYFQQRDYAVDGQIGLEDSIEEYVSALCVMGCEWMRVLRPDGTLWLVIGDTYDGDKNKLLIPHRVALAFKRLGFVLRAEVPWLKPNVLPSSASDRPTISHETMFLFSISNEPVFWTHPTKRGVRDRPDPDYVWTHVREHDYLRRGLPSTAVRDCPVRDPKLRAKFWTRRNLWESHDYYYDRYAVLQELAATSLPGGRGLAARSDVHKWSGDNAPQTAHTMHKGHQGGDVLDSELMLSLHGRQWRTLDAWRTTAHQAADVLDTTATRLREQVSQGRGFITDFRGQPVATIVNVHAYKGQHYAAFPKVLVEDPMEASTPPMSCGTCGAPYFRIVETDLTPLVEIYTGQARKDYATHLAQNPSDTKRRILESMSRTRKRDRWVPTCGCPTHATKPAEVLDPMMGTGTVGVVAVAKGRFFWGNDLNPDYARNAIDRILLEGLGVRVLRVGDLELRDDLLW